VRADLAISHNHSSRWQKLADVPETDFERIARQVRREAVERLDPPPERIADLSGAEAAAGRIGRFAHLCRCRRWIRSASRSTCKVPREGAVRPRAASPDDVRGRPGTRAAC
jgi:hypothetical protein